jgi:hypothetical protein
MATKTLTTRYKPLPPSCVSTSISLHRNRRSLRPLFALLITPSFKSFRGPRWRVGAVRSRRLRSQFSTIRSKDAEKKHAPLSNPQILADLAQSFFSFLLPYRLVHVFQNFLCCAQSSTDVSSFLSIAWELDGDCRRLSVSCGFDGSISRRGVVCVLKDLADEERVSGEALHWDRESDIRGYHVWYRTNVLGTRR